MKKVISLCAALLLSTCLSMQAQANNTVLSSPVDLDKVIVEKPVGQIIDPNYGVISFHNGTLFRLSEDIQNSGEPLDILTPYAGRIFYAGLDNTYGTIVKIIHDNGSTSTFGGMDLDSLISSKYRVERGEKIGHFIRTADHVTANNHLYFEHTLENGHNLSFNFQDLQNKRLSSFTVSAQNLGLAQQYYVPLKKDNNDDGGIRPYSFSGKSSTQSSQETIARQEPTKTKRNNRMMSVKDFPVRSVLKNAPTYISIANGSDGSNVRYQSLAYGLAGPAAAATPASATPTCPQNVKDGLMQRSEQRLQNQKNLRNAVISEPGNVSDLSCFDDFQSIMSSVVSGSGLSGGINIFGQNVDLVGMGMNALANGACNQANALMSDVRNKAIDMNAMYASQYRAWESGQLQNLSNSVADFAGEEHQEEIEGRAIDLYNILISPPDQ